MPEEFVNQLYNPHVKTMRLVLTGCLVVAAVAAWAGTGTQTAQRLVELVRERLLLSRQLAMARFNADPSQDPSHAPDIPVDAGPKERYVDRILRSVGQQHEFAHRVLYAQLQAGEIAQREFLIKWKGHARFSHVPSRAQTLRRLHALDKRIARMCGRDALGTDWRTFKAIARGVKWPAADRACFAAAWSEAVAPLVSEQ